MENDKHKTSMKCHRTSHGCILDTYINSMGTTEELNFQPLSIKSYKSKDQFICTNR